MVRQVIQGRCDVFLLVGCNDFRIFADGDVTVFRDVHKAAQTVARDDAAEIILQGMRTHIDASVFVYIVVSSGDNGVHGARLKTVAGDVRTFFHHGPGGSVDYVVSTGTAQAHNFTMPFRCRQTCLIPVGGRKGYIITNIPFATNTAFHGAR